MPSLVAPQQCSFVPGKHSSDNIIVAQDVFHSMRSRKGKKGFVAIKLDLEKAYDRIRLEFLEDTLVKVGFGEHFRSLILNCVSSATMRILFNGEKTDVFAPARRIRQGDPLSPYLFVLCMEIFSHCIFYEMDKHSWRPVILSKGGPNIYHLFFADDLLLFGEASNEQINVMIDCLKFFCLASGQKVNVEKTRILVSNNVNHNVARELCRIFGFMLTHDLGKYLGVPLLHRPTNRETFNHLLDRTQQRLCSWRAETLSFAGRVTLVQFVVAALPTYTMQTTLLPKYVCNKLEHINRDFIRGARESSESCHTIAWGHFTKPKKDGGMGFRDLHVFNKALLMKLGWVSTNPMLFRPRFCGINMVVVGT